MGGGDVVPDQRKVDVQVFAASLKFLPISFSPSPLSLSHPLKIGVAEPLTSIVVLTTLFPLIEAHIDGQAQSSFELCSLFGTRIEVQLKI